MNRSTSRPPDEGKRESRTDAGGGEVAAGFSGRLGDTVGRSTGGGLSCLRPRAAGGTAHHDSIQGWQRSEEHTSELQSQSNLVCRLLLEKKKKKRRPPTTSR